MTARDTFDLTVRRVIRAPRQKVFDAFPSRISSANGWGRAASR